MAHDPAGSPRRKQPGGPKRREVTCASGVHAPQRWHLFVGSVALAFAFAIAFPGLLLHLDIGSHDVRLLVPADRPRAVNDVRATLLQGLAGGLLLAGAYLTWRQLQVNRERTDH